MTTDLHQRSETGWKHALRVAAPAIGIGLAVRIIVLIWFSIKGYNPNAVAAMHDGAEYLDYARSFLNGTLGTLPEDVRRHDPGWPLLLSPVLFVFRANIVAIVFIWALMAGTLVICGRIFLEYGRTDPRSTRNLLIVLAAGYPAVVYYQVFALTEASFLMCVAGSSWYFLQAKSARAYLLAGAAALIRTPGVLLLGVMVLVDIRRRNWAGLAYSALALLPQAVWQGISFGTWNSTSTLILSPEMGFPFSSLAHLEETGAIRAVYVLAIILFSAVAGVLLLRDAVRDSFRDSYTSLAAVFASAFLLFHSCIHSMVYLGKPVYSFHYMDRYLVGSLPFALFAFRRWLKTPIVLVAVAASLGISLYWSNNYVRELSRLAQLAR